MHRGHPVECSLFDAMNQSVTSGTELCLQVPNKEKTTAHEAKLQNCVSICTERFYFYAPK